MRNHLLVMDGTEDSCVQIGKTDQNGLRYGRFWQGTERVSSHCITHPNCICPVGVDLAGLGFIRTGAQARCSHRGPLQQMKQQGAYALFHKPCLMYLASM